MSLMTEKDVRLFWETNKIVSLLDEQNKGGQKFNFYDGPPFASGNPHHGHLLTSAIKDTVIRYHLMCGNNVRRVWGWDTHGVPIESKANSQLNITCKEDVIKMGIDKYNGECRKYVMQCQDKWRQVITKLGRWVDMKNSYKTMDLSFMNSVWYMFKQLFDKDLIYNGVKIMSYSPGLESPLSNNEANQNYKTVSDPSLTVVFPAEFHDSYIDNGIHTATRVNILVWTTTPWTLPSNMLVCVHPDLDYVFIEYDNEIYFLLENRVKSYFKKDFKILHKIKGAEVVGVQYQPLFDFYQHFQPAKPDSKQFRVVADPMVSSETGTGIVHIAPGFGQEDRDVSDKYGLTSDTVLPPCPLDDKCYFTEPLTSMDILRDKFCQDCNVDIIKYLKGLKRVFKSEKIQHDYPFCYRTDTPLIYRTCTAWFIKVKKHIEAIKENLMKTNWIPSYVKDHKYMQLLECCVDWCVSRNRFWGTPLPIWTNGDEIIVVGSAEELEELAGLEKGSLTDLHPEHVWKITIPSSKPNGKPLENVGLVLDCWFESGSMPFGQWGYPYNKDVTLDEIFPAEFIAEGTDQTRGWFHAMMTLYTLVLDRPPFKNVIVNGIVQSRVPGTKNEWTKMSKKDGNYTDPETLIDEMGADTLRLFLINSPGVRAGDVPFDVKTFKDIHKNYYIVNQNMVMYWKQAIDIYKRNYNEEPEIMELESIKDKLTLIDIWILQELENYMDKMSTEYSEYKLYYLVDHIGRFIDRISRWYIKLNKKNLKGDNGQTMFDVSLSVLTHTLYYLSLMMAPIAPFMTESFYQFMKKLCTGKMFNAQSIHLNRIIKPKLDIQNVNGLMDAMDFFIKSINLTRRFRDENNKPIKMPLKNVTIAHNNSDILLQLSKLSMYMKQEINSRQMEYIDDPFKYIMLKYRPNLRVIGQTFKKDAKDINKYLATLDVTYKDFENGKTIDYTCKSGTQVQLDKTYFHEYTEIIEEAKSDEHVILYDDRFVMVFNMETDDDILKTYYANCVCREVQQMRKEHGLTPADKILVTYNDDDMMNNLMMDVNYKVYMSNMLGQTIELFNIEAGLPIDYSSERDGLADKYKLTINFHKC